MPSNTSKSSKTSPKVRFPTISVIIPTLNAASVLTNCLKSIQNQKYPSNLVKIIIADGGSTDNTLTIAKHYHCITINNPLKTAESGKAAGLKHVKSDYVALIDSDNILPHKNWLTTMITPFITHNDLIGSEPWEYTYRSNAGFIERYSALTGVNDPYCLVAGNYDRKSILNKNWTTLDIPITNYQDYQIATLKPHTLLPTIGANGTIFKTNFLKRYFDSDYFFDIDIIESALNQSKRSLSFAKVKVGIIHTFCESSINKFYKKQLRRATDLYLYKNQRQYTLTKNNLLPTIKFILYVILFFPMIYDSIRGFFKKPDIAWFAHPILCIITLYCYSLITIKSKLNILKAIDRTSWQQ